MAHVPAGKTRKGKNFSAEEERSLCRSFLAVSQDPICGKSARVAPESRCRDRLAGVALDPPPASSTRWFAGLPANATAGSVYSVWTEDALRVCDRDACLRRYCRSSIISRLQRALCIVDELFLRIDGNGIQLRSLHWKSLHGVIWCAFSPSLPLCWGFYGDEFVGIALLGRSVWERNCWTVAMER